LFEVFGTRRAYKLIRSERDMRGLYENASNVLYTLIYDVSNLEFISHSHSPCA